MTKETITEVMDIRSGKIHKSYSLLKDRVKAFQLRRRLQEAYQGDEKLLVCPACNQIVQIRGGNKLSRHFAHYSDSGYCPIKAGERISKQELLARKFKGQKESETHKRLKMGIASVLDNHPNFENIFTEKTFIGEEKDYKRPDVKADHFDHKFVFEIQLATTFLSVIVERENFYRKNNSFIVWIFNKFPNNEEQLVFTQSDIYFNNNLNAFVIDDQLIGKSLVDKKFYLKVFYSVPYRDEPTNKILNRIKEKIIEFSELTIDHNNHSLFYHDYKKAKDELVYRSFIDEVFNDMEAHKNRRYEHDELAYWKNKYQQEGYEIENFNDFFDVLLILYSLQRKQSFGHNYGNIRQLVFHLYDHRKEYSWIAEKALHYFDIHDDFCKADKKKTLSNLIERNQHIVKKQDLNEIICEFFPGLEWWIN